MNDAFLSDWDAVVVGAGPAGMAFAAEAAGKGMGVLVLDDQASPGGQIYRNIEAHPAGSLQLMGKDYRHGHSLVKRFRKSDATYRNKAVVWKIEADGRVAFSRQGHAYEVRGRRVIVATGAMERPVPFPGWTLPGVMGAGGADALYKGTGMVPEGPVALAGSGPLIYAVAGHLSKMGVTVSHFLDTTPPLGAVKALGLLPRALGRPGYLLKGVEMLARIWKIAGTVKREVTRYCAHGDERLEKISFDCRGRTHKLATQTLLVHEGIIPRSDFARQLHLAHLWEPVQRYWYPRLDPFGRTSKKRIYIAGDGGFVHGAAAAEKKGRLAALDIAADLGHVSNGEKAVGIKSVMRGLKREIRPRPFIDKAFSPRSGLYNLDDETLVCRCEEVTVAKIRTAILQGMVLPEAVKSLTRCGMGPCQSRMCGPGFMELVAKETGQALDALSPLNIRPPVRNLNAAELADMTLFHTSTGG